MGRLVNHSKKANCVPVVVNYNKQPRVLLQALSDIESNEELLYNYNDKENVTDNPWLKF